MPRPEKEVLFVSHKYPPATGGMEKQSYELINGATLYIKVHTLIYDPKEPIIRFFRKLNSRILQKLQKHPQIGLIHFNDGLIAALATYHKGYAHLRKVVTLHGLDVVFPWTYFQKKILPRFNAFDKIIAVSDATAHAAFERGIAKEKLIVINNGVDQYIVHKSVAPMASLYAQYPVLRHSKNYFITLGRPVKRKGFSWLLEEVIPALEGDFQLLMVGPFDRKAAWREKVLSLLPQRWYRLITLFLGFPTDQRDIRKQLKRLEHRATHLGKVPFEDLQILLHHATAFLMPNIPVKGDMEGFGLVCLEASLSGTLVVASELEGITNAIHQHINGILLPTQHSETWIAQLQAIIQSPEHHRQLGKQYQQKTLELFSWDKMCREYVQLFEGILADSPCGRNDGVG